MCSLLYLKFYFKYVVIRSDTKPHPYRKYNRWHFLQSTVFHINNMDYPITPCAKHPTRHFRTVHNCNFVSVFPGFILCNLVKFYAFLVFIFMVCTFMIAVSEDRTQLLTNNYFCCLSQAPISPNRISHFHCI